MNLAVDDRKDHFWSVFKLKTKHKASFPIGYNGIYSIPMPSWTKNILLLGISTGHFIEVAFPELGTGSL